MRVGRPLVPLTLVSMLVACGGDDTGGEADAATESGNPDSGRDTAADAPPDAPGDAEADSGDAAPPARVACAWKNPAPIVVEDLSLAGGTGFFNGELFVAEPSASEVRIISQPSGGPAFRVYGFDRATAAISNVDGPVVVTSSFLGAEHFTLPSSAGVSQVLVQTEAQDGALSIDAYLVADTMPRSGPLPARIAVSPGGFGVAAFPLDESTVFDAVTYTSGVSGSTVYRTLGVGRATSATPATLATVTVSTDRDDLLRLEIAHAGGQAYVFGSNGAAHPGESLWVVPDTAVLAGPVNARVFDVGTTGRMIDVAPSTTAATTNFAYYSAVPGAAGGTLRVGQIGDSKLGAASAADLVIAREYPDGWLASAVVTAEWSGDDMMIVAAAPPPGDGGAASGMNVLWVDAKGDLRAEQVGATVLSPERTGIRAASASRASATSWDVAWVERRGGGEVLLYNQLDCK
jgi:hypothetical protein